MTQIHDSDENGLDDNKSRDAGNASGQWPVVEFPWDEKLLVRAEVAWCDNPDGSGAPVLVVRRLFGVGWDGPVGY